jgi:hypothetical protein
MRRDHPLFYLPHLAMFGIFLLIAGIDSLLRQTLVQMLLLICGTMILVIGMLILFTPLGKRWHDSWWMNAAKVGMLGVYGLISVIIYETLLRTVGDAYAPTNTYSGRVGLLLLFLLLIVGAFLLARLLWAGPRDEESARPQLSPRREVQILADDGQITTISTKQLRRLRREGKQIVVLDGEPDEAPRQQMK